jgi:hypothetical protein
MTSRDLIHRVTAFAGAARIGLNLPPPWGSDLVFGGLAPAPGFDPQRRREGDAEVWLDEWGNTWKRLGGISKGEVAQGAITDWSQLGSYRPPDLGLPARYDKARRAFAEAPGKYRIGGIPGCAFNVSRYIRRLENFLADCLLEPDRVRALNRLVMGELEKAVRGMAAAGADAVMFPEDWGTQDRLLMSPETFRRLFRPELERLCGVARDAGVAVWMHSCGAIGAIIPDLIAAGVRVLQFDQPALHGIDHLAAAYGGRVTFMCPVDIQRTLQSRDEEAIRAEAEHLVEALGRHVSPAGLFERQPFERRGFERRPEGRRDPDLPPSARLPAPEAGADSGPFGGFIATRYGDERAIGLEPKWQDIACAAFAACGGPGRPARPRSAPPRRG